MQTNAMAARLPPVLRKLKLTVEEAEKIRQMMDDPNEPRHVGKEMASADPSVLRKPKEPT